MIEKIIGATIVPDIQALAWADQIGYMVKPWTKKVQSAEGEFKDIIYPVAEFVTNPDCEVQDYGLNVITTDKGYQSLILISAEGDMSSTIAENIPQRKALNIEQDIKISVWLNNHQGSTHIAKGELMKALFNAIYKQVKVVWPYTTPASDDVYDMFINKLKVSFVREIVTNPFSEYSFASDQAQFNNNYSAFGFVFKLTGLVFPDCFPAYPEFTTECDAALTNEFTVSIQEQDGYAAICIGGELVLEGTVTGGLGTATYQWYKMAGDSWEAILGATDINYTFESDDPERDETFRLQVTKLGITNQSDPLTISLREPPSVYTFAQSYTITTGQTTTIVGEVLGGYGSINFQWQKYIAGDWQDLDGETSPDLIVDGSVWGVGVHHFKLTITQDAAACFGNGNQESITITA